MGLSISSTAKIKENARAVTVKLSGLREGAAVRGQCTSGHSLCIPEDVKRHSERYTD